MLLLLLLLLLLSNSTYYAIKLIRGYYFLKTLYQLVSTMDVAFFLPSFLDVRRPEHLPLLPMLQASSA